MLLKHFYYNINVMVTLISYMFFFVQHILHITFLLLHVKNPSLHILPWMLQILYYISYLYITNLLLHFIPCILRLFCYILCLAFYKSFITFYTLYVTNISLNFIFCNLQIFHYIFLPYVTFL